MKTIIVAGGGIAGIVAALVLSQKNQVYLVEKESEVGGLLRSIKIGDNYFDYGTHMMRMTGIAELDQILFGDDVHIRAFFNQVIFHHVGAFANGRFVDNNICYNTNFLEKKTYEQGVSELINASITYNNRPNTLKEQLEGMFGPTFVRSIFEKSIRKFAIKEDLSNLAINTHHLFGLGRILIENEEETQILKKTNKNLDNAIAFHNPTEGASPLLWLYPKEKGAGNWINYLVNKLKAANVKILTNATISQIITKGKSVKGVKINDEVVDCDNLVWTLPAFLFLKNINSPKAITMQPPKKLFTHLLHFIVNKEYDTKSVYYHNYDPDYLEFRTTLYGNFTEYPKNHFTVEVLSNSPTFDDTLTHRLFNQIKTIIYTNPENVDFFHVHKDIVFNGFPIQTVDFVSQNQRLNNEVTKRCSNVFLCGKSSGNSFFSSDVIINTYEQVKQLNGCA
jgi:protoporphyrinogen oxidase